MRALTVLLDSLVDYAGLFPPAQLSMEVAVAHYADYRQGPHRASLGRFIVPLARLAEFESCFQQLPPLPAEPWTLSVIGGSDPLADCRQIEQFNTRSVSVRIVALEIRALTVADVQHVTARPFAPASIWVELPAAAPELPALLAAVKTAGQHAKLRTGGVTPAAIPHPDDVAQFMIACRAAGVAFKATAGLHHAWRGEYALTDEPDASVGTLFGFLNIFLAAALVQTNAPEADVRALLEARDPCDFTLTDDALAWRDHRFTIEQLGQMRRTFCHSFGSCSFTEPIADLQALHWL
ncbi:MAG: hypothetical protein Q8M02_14765 [Candidatus Didemnitutus sp.]|nr:hypothetical protein [Candidatus Didemnitutus sp.]